MRISILPKERRFYALYEQQAAHVVDALDQLVTAMQGGRVDESTHVKLRDLEHAGDTVMHELVHTLNRTFVTPFDREDIYQLASGLDDILDYAEEISDTIVLYNITSIPPAAIEMASLLSDAAKQLQQAIGRLESRVGLEECGIEIHRLENAGDTCSRAAIGALFRGDIAPLEVIKLKDLYSLLEEALDRCEDVANVIQTILIKNA